MTSIGRIDQAILLLKDRLQRLGEQSGKASAGTTRQQESNGLDPLVPLRQLARQGRISRDDLRKALVRTLLAESLGEELVASLEFQSIADRVTGLLEENEAGRDLLDRALGELE